MGFQVEETGPVERLLRVEVPTAEVDAAFESVYREIGRRARVPGFRPGKAPRPVLERLLHPQARAEVMDRLVEASLPRALKEAQLEVVGDPRLRPGAEPKQGAPFAYEVALEIRPRFELRRVRGLEVSRPTLPEPAEDPVERYLAELREAHAPLVEEREGTTAARGRVVVLDYEGACEGRPFEGGSGQGVTLELGSGRAIPGFEEGIEGMAVGDEREIELLLPESHPVGALRGKPARFRVRLLALKRKELPELDDELAKDVSEFATLEELRADLRRRLAEGRAREERRLLREAVARRLIEENPFPVPPSLVERQLSVRISRAASELGSRVSEEGLRELADRWRREWRDPAEKEVALRFLVDEIARGEGFEVTDEEVERRLQELARERGVTTAAQLRREGRAGGLLQGLRASLLEERVLEFLVSEATVLDG
jgi:trigger factor